MGMREAVEKTRDISGNARGGPGRPQTAAAPASSLAEMLPMIITALK
jgi:hypothetical protein